MQEIGIVNRRQIFYTNVRTEAEWFYKLPFDNWCAFTIADNEDHGLIEFAVEKCLDKLVLYSCSAGQLARETELSFDSAIVNRAIAQEDKTGQPFDYEHSPLTTIHENFSEGFWFSTTVAHDGYKEITIVICIDFTTKGVKCKLIELIEKINEGWLPSDEEIEAPIYDK